MISVNEVGQIIDEVAKLLCINSDLVNLSRANKGWIANVTYGEIIYSNFSKSPVEVMNSLLEKVKEKTYS
jgi:hypothetical protein